MKRVLVAIASCGVIAACQPAPPVETASTPEISAIDTMTFAPTLQIDIAKFSKTRTGAYYLDVVAGKGASAGLERTVAVRYVLYLANGTVVETQNTPMNVTIKRDEVIRGWFEGLPGMKVGGIRKLVVPPELGYGRTAHGTIPAQSTLVFEVELVAVR